MENNVYNPSRKIKRATPGLLPNYFKKIGIVITLLAIVVALLIKTMVKESAQEQKDILKLLIMNSFILGLMFIAWAKDKTEDEMTLALRLKTIGFTFIWAVFYAIGKPLTDLILNDPIEDLSASGLVLSMLIFYHFIYFLQKKGR